VYDNLAREPEEVAVPERRPQRRRRRKVYPQQKPVAMPSISGASFLFLLAAAVVTVTICFIYLHVQSGITSMKNQVVSLQSEIAQTKEENEEAYQRIMDSVDLAEVYAIATGELGMTQAVDNQVYKYDNNKSDMVKQYADIPSATK
jgi:cell division protein FtsL